MTVVLSQTHCALRDGKEKQMGISQIILSVWDQEELHYIVEELIIALRYDYFRYDDEGNNLLDACRSEKER